jgi:ribosomal protein S18 acetylase RimI-like enzyme
MEPLDNPAWHSLELQPAFARIEARVRRYLPEVDPIAALPDDATSDDWGALAPTLAPGEAVHMLRPSFELPPTWTALHEGTVMQMVGVERPDDEYAIEFLDLGPADAPEMLELAAATRPGPFTTRTHELGRFVGIREGGRLVAMAGERFVLPGMTEVSAVCTDPVYRGRGWAAALAAEVARRIYDRGEVPFLHVVESNRTARRVYERIGFRDRAVLAHVLVSPAAE